MACEARLAVSVPLPAIGEPETLNIEGSERPTLVTVPVPQGAPESCTADGDAQDAQSLATGVEVIVGTDEKV
jgi:hypothetical protein